MSKTITSLEKETLMWKGRYEKSNKSLLEMAQEVGYHSNTLWTHVLLYMYNMAPFAADDRGTKCSATEIKE